MEKIEAQHLYIKNLFDDDYLFEIPEFQRPFSWEQENFEKLFDDIKSAIKDNATHFNSLNDYEPYFLGSLIQLEKENDGKVKYSLIDGQQRMVSLTILMAVIRDLIDHSDYKTDLQESIYQKASEAKGQSESMRIEMRDREKDFFKDYILKNGGTIAALNMNKNESRNLSDPKKRILAAVQIFRNGFVSENNINQHLLREYTQYLLQKVIMVVITTRSLDSAFRLFNVVNARGMPLTNADLLKSINLGTISEDHRKKFTKIWEDVEEDIGIESLEMLISLIRTIKIKNRATKNIYDEFEGKIFAKDPQFKGENFILYLNHIKEIYEDKVLDASIKTGDVHAEIYYYNLMSIMRDFLPFNDWLAALITFYEKFEDDDNLYSFLINLERKIFIDWVTGLSLPERLTRIYRIIRLIEEKDQPEEILNNQMFHSEIKNRLEVFKNSFDHENFYSKGRYQIAKYVLLRMDMEKHEMLTKRVAFSGNITVEHILPRTPNQYWKNKFSEVSRQEWTNKLGNLALLNGAKNSAASNRPFSDKIKTYFQKKSDFVITNELENLNDWNMDELQLRHKNLKKEALDIWIK